MERFSQKKEVKMLKQLCDTLDKSVFIVGGFTREVLSDMKTRGKADIDICSNFDAELFENCGARVTTINKALGTFKIEYNGFSFEYTRFRRESYNNEGAHTPSTAEFIDDINIDAKRRDFTINSIYYDVKNNQIIDPLGGVKDLESKVIRCYDPIKVFSDDGLRILRLVRISAQTGFNIEKSTLSNAKKYSKNLAKIASERKRDELNLILTADTKYKIENAHYNGLKLLWQLGLFKYLIPPMLDMEIGQNPRYHKYNVLEHTFKTVQYAPANIRLPALLHDIGKPVAMLIEQRMANHDFIGERIARDILLDLKYSKKEIEHICRLIRHHMFDLKRNVKEGKMRLFCVNNFDILDDLEALAIADSKATGQEILNTPRFIKYKNMILKCKIPLSTKDLKINGEDCIKAKVKKDKIALVLTALWRECVLNVRLNDREWLLNWLNRYAPFIN